MTPELLLAFAGYAFATSITPGPNNVMLLASGANFGLDRSLPHMAGINLGFGAMVLAIGLGAEALFAAFPALDIVLRLAGGGYLLWLAWRIANAAPPETAGRSAPRPLSFLGAAAFQWVNPKAWLMAMGAVTAYLPATAEGWPWLAVLVALFMLVNAPCLAVWTVAGTAVSRLLGRSIRFRIFNLAMALLLCLSLLPMVLE
ncbi:LysE family translocator [Marinibaculum pumilum]|uniref:LysE family translocator n=1 Tax=Marinibaculum pumilum TaxID=1766165 RepID=A0ABV7KUE0_9PROT